MAEICEHCKKPWATVDDDESHMHQLAGGDRPAEWVDFRGSHLCWRGRVLDQGPARPARYAGSCALEVGEGVLILEVARLLGLQSHAIGSWDYSEIIREVEALLHQVAALHEGQSTLAKHIERLTTDLRDAVAEKARLQSLVVASKRREPAACTRCHGDLVVCRECSLRRTDMRHVDMVVGHGPCRGAGWVQCPLCHGRGGIWRAVEPEGEIDG